MNLRILGNFLSSCETIMSFSKRSLPQRVVTLVSDIRPVYTALLTLLVNIPQIC
jgi:hypothetical protein